MRALVTRCCLWFLLVPSTLAACGGGSSGGSPSTPETWCIQALRETVCAAPGVLPNGTWSAVGAPCAVSTSLRVGPCDLRTITGATTVPYPVAGATPTEACDDIFSNSGPQDPQTGQRYGGRTDLEWQVQGTVTPKADGSKEIHITGVDYSISVQMPQWEPPPGTSAEDLAAWEDFVNEVEKHEQGHVDRIKEGMSAVVAAVT